MFHKSCCHWCHVMAHESFEDTHIAEILSKNFVSIKVDKEERPDIDSIYMSVCQALTGSGGWPASIFLTAEQKPFFAGTYFPKNSRYGMLGFAELLTAISERWENSRDELKSSSEEIISAIKETETDISINIDVSLPQKAAEIFRRTYDKINGGFGKAPKFPSPHNLMFLLNYYRRYDSPHALEMVENTLTKMYKGGIFDHIGYGFSRYSTDDYFLVPHFEKMLYDNALLMISYAEAYHITENPLFKSAAEKTAEYVLREMTSPSGGFYSAQDADSSGVEGKYYVFEYYEIISVLGEEAGKKFNEYYGITEEGNFEGKNIPNLLDRDELEYEFSGSIRKLYEYRKSRTKLHLDDKIITSWNSLMIAAFAVMYQVFGYEKYLKIAENAQHFIEENLCENDTLYVSIRDGERSVKGFIDDYAFYAYALLNLYDVTLNREYLTRAEQICEKAENNFRDGKNGGYFLCGKENERLITKPKETYDGAIPSGNSVMAYNLVRLSSLSEKSHFPERADEQMKFISSRAKEYPAGNSFFLTALMRFLNPPERIVCVFNGNADISRLKNRLPMFCDIIILDNPTEDYPLLNDLPTFYVCKDHACLPPVNELPY